MSIDATLVEKLVRQAIEEAKSKNLISFNIVSHPNHT